jgi:hypothetical protein
MALIDDMFKEGNALTGVAVGAAALFLGPTILPTIGGALRPVAKTRDQGRHRPLSRNRGRNWRMTIVPKRPERRRLEAGCSCAMLNGFSREPSRPAAAALAVDPSMPAWFPGWLSGSSSPFASATRSVVSAVVIFFNTEPRPQL